MAPMADATHDQFVDRTVTAGGVTMLVGGPDTGKTTLAKKMLAAAVELGMKAAYVDADVAQSTVGPPTCVGLRWVRSTADLQSLWQADDLR